MKPMYMGLLDTASKPLRQVGSVGRFATQKGTGLLHEARSRLGRSGGDLNDPAIARKVETVVFRSPGVDKGKIDVNVVDGVVFLRGTAKNPAQVRSIEAAARGVPEVVDVENLLHLPNTPARAAKRQTRTGPRAKPRSLNADKTSPRQPDAPVELAAPRKGRPPANLGSDDS